ncbi:hypothetical protein U3516DRAFT_801711 [Neocallimastix sp. 'constans']
MSKGLITKEALKLWEEKYGSPAAETTVIKLFMQQPFIQLSLSTNNIEKINGLDAISETLEELWIYYNLIEKYNGIECCKKLKVFYASNNKVKAWEGIACVSSLSELEDVLLSGNPLEEKCTSEGTWRDEFSKK